uniref:Nuclear receptor domain-containing protein n=1 Tax=Ditylenchus dipsaci TaxID=166011 RepID=A0A915DNC1_9BILA
MKNFKVNVEFRTKGSGDKACSYNFNVITCESCKAFFRRNANKEKVESMFVFLCKQLRDLVTMQSCYRIRLLG